MDELELDTTPSKSMVAKTLGGPFTFLGQYEDEGVVLMIRNLPPDIEEDDEDALQSLNVSELRALCDDRDIATERMLEKADLIHALKDVPPVNTHNLQPPLHNAVVRGDILVMKVAETKDDEDNPPEKIEVATNEEFFLDYTKEEYIKFASRTDIEEHEIEVPSEDEEEESEGDEEEDVLFRLGKDSPMDGIEDDDKSAMFNLVMNEVLRQYREENGRGPNTQELLDLRATIAKELDVEVAQVEDADWNKKAKETPSKNAGKRIGFHEEDKVLEYQPHENEHNHHQLGDDDDDDDDDEEYEEEEGDGDEHDDDEEQKESEEPPKKKLKTAPEEAKANGNDDNDTKPAAAETTPTSSAAETTATTTQASDEKTTGDNDNR
jgi:hypothetical protein